MKLFTDEQYQQLLKNGHPENRDQDHPPVVHLTLPGTDCQWLLSEIDPENPSIAFGLCDLGVGSPEMGYVDLEDLKKIKSEYWSGNSVLINPLFEGKYPLSVYWRASKVHSCITRDEKSLMQASHAKKDKPQP